jgi:hypothetical protein
MNEISRRTLLSRGLVVVAIGGGAALGVTKSVHHKVAVPPPPPPDALVAALTNQRRLLAGYDAALAARPDQVGRLTPLRADIAAHGAALRAVLEQYPGWRYAQSQPSVGPSPGGLVRPAIAGELGALAQASKQDAASVTTACVKWPAGEPQAGQVVPLLGSIAACLTSHAGVLS